MVAALLGTGAAKLKRRRRGDKRHRHNAGLQESGGSKSPLLPYDLWRLWDYPTFSPLDEALTSRAVCVIVSGSDGRAVTLLEPTK